MAIIDIQNEQEFDERTSTGVSLVVFHSLGCSACRAKMPSLMRIETQLPFTNLLRVNVDECEALSERFKIHATPTIMLCKDGELAPYTGDARIAYMRRAVGELVYGERV